MFVQKELVRGDEPSSPPVFLRHSVGSKNGLASIINRRIGSREKLTSVLFVSSLRWTGIHHINAQRQSDDAPASQQPQPASPAITEKSVAKREINKEI